jgi:hypothetical protein
MGLETRPIFEPYTQLKTKADLDNRYHYANCYIKNMEILRQQAIHFYFHDKVTND